MKTCTECNKPLFDQELETSANVCDECLKIENELDDPQGEVDRDNMRAIGLSAGSKIQLT